MLFATRSNDNIAILRDTQQSIVHIVYFPLFSHRLLNVKSPHYFGDIDVEGFFGEMDTWVSVLEEYLDNIFFRRRIPSGHGLPGSARTLPRTLTFQALWCRGSDLDYTATGLGTLRRRNEDRVAQERHVRLWG
jgi:hypothetical protein